ncbi:2-polyprenyl-3-methyl-5-hydroxy-6-metoxy-1,4-benzoquinol methylase [Kribbella amoyensis]|uniref:2-polyprenyl-3-methyl-5-hydroxy-6-metoxy-1, 4-benzoquinol methylase n=1 Tax=Kribbella amoyensis TaxID=996641 RepID=A0A561BT25_9ACTN|nr:class I SAM-dependent methyltransferase [Kribbella amoyensis]TWD81979.1 2-polyprenyl-3-methyl-5-hydroxy-6-metoxy-1,4-benzoquinol methylase [Kribbella amoyensis]
MSGQTSGGYDPEKFERLFALDAGSFWFRARSDLIGWALDRNFPAARSFLELGCGNGYVIDRVRRDHPDWRLVGTELFEEGLANARIRMPEGVELRQLDATENPYDAEFDVAGAFDVIEHIEDAPAVLAGMFASVRPGGGVLITVPQHKWLWSKADVAAHHVKRYTRRELIGELQDAGFEVLRVTSFVSLLLPAMMASRLVKRDAADVEGELDMAAPLNTACYQVMRAEGALIRAGLNLPAGGSLLAVARRPRLPG